ncbi:PrsW family glutamic-type intramembrane protease [Limosilactobacillus antri]|uniref:PrsW family glutamic-type intramembrane protease n=1 Tax=Limosilactobacillus antri TaxID=227943 RepID=UPI001F5AA1BC|nr:PrsW family intramembrane metalloprotease [Limosilactobacillus antri]
MPDSKIVFCTNCGAKNSTDSKFCINCGKPLVKSNVQVIDSTSNDNEESINSSNKQGVMDNVTSHINAWTGGKGAVKVSLSEFFSQVFRRHTTEEAEELFIVGTDKTTPSLSEIVNDKVQPWLFSRVLGFVLAIGILMYFLLGLLPAYGIWISMDAFLAVAVPLSALVLFFECNVFQNISFYQVTKMALLGGVLSLIVTILFVNFFGNRELDLLGALQTGFVEELSKVLVAAYFVYKIKAKRIFNGLLIGAAVGTGFAAFENVEYMFNDKTGQIASMQEAIGRTMFSISDHTEWCAIATAALVMVIAGKQLSSSDFFNFKFLRFLLLVMIIHALWDWNALNQFGTLRYMALAVATWIVVFVFIHAGLREVKLLQSETKDSQINI